MGTGTSQGVPLIAYDHTGIDLNDRRNWRTRTSAHVVMDGLHVQIDAGPEFRLQCLHNSIRQLDVFILTHGHADHVVGMDDLRRFCDLRDGEALPVYGTEEGLTRVRSIYPYAILDRPVHRGYPAFKLHPMPQVLEFKEGTVRSVLLPHGGISVLGLIFEERSSGARIAYYSDCGEVGEEARGLARGADLLVLDALRFRPHRSHLTVEQAIEVARDIAPKRTLFTHMTHEIDHASTAATLPPTIELAWDGLRVEIGKPARPMSPTTSPQ